MDFTRLAEVVEVVERALPVTLIEELAEQLGAARRRRRIPIAPLVYTLVLAGRCP